MMKKLIMAATMLAVVAAMAVPAVAAERPGWFDRFNPYGYNPAGYSDRFDPYGWGGWGGWGSWGGGGSGWGGGGSGWSGDPAGVSQGLAQRSTTGNVSNSFTATSSGDNSNQCVTPMQFGNTGSQQNIQGVLQYGSQSGDINETGGTFVIAPSLNAQCNPAVEQSSAASSG
jgi:hypothetical protein